MTQNGRATAIACVRGGDTFPNLYGMVRFIPRGSCTLVVAEISNLPATDTDFFAFHIHEGGNCSGIDFSNTGSHYNPNDREHPQHAGDLPSLLSCGGSAFLAVLTDRFRVKDILGKTVVIHSQPDDFTTQPSGNAGNKIACGVICKA